ncbi:MAG: alpha-L-arabinofuranosidase C-terminal domain-containing protein [Phycisphaerae bacterium]
MARATIEIDTTSRRRAVSRRLFGKFTEHLGTNVYQGAWAQLVVNPEFAPAERWAKREALNSRLERYGTQVGMPDLVKAADAGFAPFWAPVGVMAGRVIREGNRDVQRLVPGRSSGEIRTGVFLPLERVRDYELTIKAMAAEPATATVAILGPSGRILVEDEIPLAQSWRQVKLPLVVPRDVPFKPGEPSWLSIALPAGATAEISRVLLFPSDHMDGWDPEIVKMLREAKLPLLRFPGGNFVSGYHWQDGVGPLDERPVLPNPAWPDVIECNHVGTDEWLRLCELVGCEALICVNAGNGTADEARQWVEYCNGRADSPMGARRAANGHAAPYNVRLWEVGNELYGDWQIGHTDAAGYAARYIEFINEMKKAAPGSTAGDLHFIANGGDEDWNRTVVQKAGPAVESISAHYLIGWNVPKDADPAAVFDEYMAWAANFDQVVAADSAGMKEAGLMPRIALTEQQVFTRQPGLPTNATQTEALWTAGTTNAAIRSGGLVELITHSALVNHGGGLRKERGIVYANPVWWVTHLYAGQPCTVPVAVRADSPAMHVAGKYFTKTADIATLDAVAMIDDAGSMCAVFVVNRSRTQAVEAKLAVNGFTPAGQAEVITLAADFMAANTWDRPRNVHPAESTAMISGGRIVHTFPACSLTRVVLTRAN